MPFDDDCNAQVLREAAQAEERTSVFAFLRVQQNARSPTQNCNANTDQVLREATKQPKSQLPNRQTPATSPILNQIPEVNIGEGVTHSSRRRTLPIPSLFHNVNTVPTQPPPQQQQQLFSIRTASGMTMMEANLQSALETGRFSDLTIKHGEKEWKAHKVVIFSQAPVLEQRVEMVADIPTIDLSVFNFDMVILLMEYFYASSYTTSQVAPDYGLPTHIRMYALATTLRVPGLQDLSCSTFRYTLNTHVTDGQIFIACISGVYTLTQASTQFYKNELRMLVVEAAASEIVDLMGEANRDAFWAARERYREFDAELLLFLVCNPQRPVVEVETENFLCDECGPREDDDGYEVEIVCKVCNEKRRLGFC